MKYSTAIGLMAIFASYALATNPTCTTSGHQSYQLQLLSQHPVEAFQALSQGDLCSHG